MVPNTIRSLSESDAEVRSYATGAENERGSLTHPDSGGAPHIFIVSFCGVFWDWFKAGYEGFDPDLGNERSEVFNSSLLL